MSNIITVSANKARRRAKALSMICVHSPLIHNKAAHVLSVTRHLLLHEDKFAIRQHCLHIEALFA